MPIKLLKEMRQRIGRQPSAVIAYPQPQAPVFRPGRNFNLTLRSILESIVQQVKQDADESLFVRKHRRAILRQRPAHAVCFRQVGNLILQGSVNPADRQRSRVKRQFTGIQRRKVQNRLDKVSQSFNFGLHEG